jgi:hypothetical protein
MLFFLIVLVNLCQYNLFLNYISVLDLTHSVSSAIRGWRFFLYRAGEGQNIFNN